MNFIPHSRPTLGREEISHISEVIESAQIRKGRKVEAFEAAFSQRMKIEYAATTSSGTAALHLALLALGVREKDEVIIPSYVCSALLNAINYVGATPVLADIDPETYNLDPNDARKRLSKHTKAVIVPHLFGMPANMEDILALDVPVIEDCAQAVGITYQNRIVGTFGVAAVFSFYATKVITTGEGGMVVSSSKEIIDQIRDLREYDEKRAYKIRFNYKMSDIQAAIGLKQLDRLDSFIQNRRAIADSYNRAFRSLDIITPMENPGHIYYRYIIGLEGNMPFWIQNLRKKGIGCARPVYKPLHLYMGLKDFPRADEAWNQTLSIPIYPTLSEEDVNRVVKIFADTYEEMTGECS